LAAGASLSLAMLAPKRSISPLTTLSFLFSAPLRLRRDLCRTLPSLGAAPSPSPSSSSSALGRASARLSSDASLLAGRRLRRRWPDLEMRSADDWTRDRKTECRMRRLSRLDSRKSSETAAPARKTLDGSRGWIWPVMRWRRRALAEGGFDAVGATGALKDQIYVSACFALP
jgi:hypothetical protein